MVEEGRYRDDDEETGQVNGNAKVSGFSDYASGSGSQTPETVSSVASSTSSDHGRVNGGEVMPTPTDGNVVGRGPGNLAGKSAYGRQRSMDHITQFPSYMSSTPSAAEPSPGIQGYPARVRNSLARAWHKTASTIATFFKNLFRSFPVPVQKVLGVAGSHIFRFVNAIYQCMNPPLWAMLIAVIVASVPDLQRLFFDKGTFINNSVTRAVSQSGGVAVPLILVVLGANLARNTIPREELATTAEEKQIERKLLYASLVSRMLLPTILMAPMLAVFAKFVPVSILDDPIFVIVCFLLTGAPSALQLAQICQLHNVYMGVMSKLLFQSYVIWYVDQFPHCLHSSILTFCRRILPSTLVLVMLALEVVEWAAA